MTGNLRHTALDWLLRVQQSPEDTGLRSDLAAWLSIDDSHAEAYRKAERVWRITGMAQAAALADEPQAPPQPTLAAHTTAAVPPARPRRRRWPGLLAGALAACLAVVIAPGAYIALQSDYRTGLGQQRTVELEDGSRIHLDSESAISVDYSDGQREVCLLAGQAFFEVAPDQARPFSVDARPLRITVTGTAFNVALRQTGLAVAVQHGSVRVEENDTTLADALSAGDRLRWQRGSHEVTRDTLPVSQIAAWQKGQLVVRDARISDVLEELRPYLPGKVSLRDAALGEQRITGVYALADPDAALRAVIQPYQGTVSIWTPWLRVIKRHP
ncbi:transmembrane sensor [Pseudomonas sp. BIGb0408]|uniref:Transmembrane sensor n=1 Tax=Phytopseudomonas flavescens TaxID=29435 RepID=A0A7Y9XR54_9GAMM|nr:MULTISPECIES: FecR domain-containing protein [Pseudomonas]MCW2294694.1 transmembrane sensor [Pseudomonas sp. BIGb0408]NYH76032.1 transmembrane sensor [Pseudomonas flavescens]